MNYIKHLLAIFSVFSILLASDLRISTLGGNAGFWDDDDSNWLIFPSRINNLDMVQFSGLGDNTVPGSAMIVWGDDATFAFKYNQALDASNDFEDGSAYLDWVNLGWGNGQLGAIINIGSWTYDSGEVNSTGSSLSFYGVGLGRNMGFGEFGTSFQMLTADDGNVNTEDEGAMMFSANIRRQQNFWLFDNMLLGYDWITTTNNDGNTETKDSKNTMDFNIDLFTHLNPSKNIDVLFALGFGYWSHTIDDGVATTTNTEQTIMTLPQSTIAVEAKLKDWAILRVGANHAYMIGTDGDKSWSGSYNYLNIGNADPITTFSWNFGLGFDFGNLIVDMAIKEHFFSDPLPYMTGFNNDDLANGSVTLTYKF